MNVYDESGLEQKVRDLLSSDPYGRVYVPPGPLTLLQRLADATGIELRVTRDCPPATIYMLTAENAENVPADYIVRPTSDQYSELRSNAAPTPGVTAPSERKDPGC